MLRCLFVCLLAIILAPRAAVAFGNCTDAGYLAQFDHRLTDGPCRELGRSDIHWGATTREMRVLMDGRSSIGTTDTFVADLADLAAHTGAAMEAFGAVQIHDVTVLLTDLPSPTHFPVIDAMTTGLSECKMTLYKSELGARDPGFVKFLIAHELFHCIQNATWSDRYRGDDAAWWVEGTAEFFANLVIQGTSYSDGRISGFESARETPLTQLSYPAVVFFFWLAQAHGLSAIPSLISAMPTEAGQSPQVEALRGLMMAGDWVEFEEAYLDEHLVKPGDHPIHNGPSQGDVRQVTGDTEIPYSVTPFVIARSQLEFERGRTYDIELLSQPSTLVMHWSNHHGPWANPPSTVDGCNAAVTYRVVVGTTASRASMRVRVRAGSAEHSCSCIVGSWQMTSESLLRNIGQMSSRTDTCSLNGGTLRLTFNDGASPGRSNPGLYDYVGITYECRQSSGGFTRTSMNGVANTLWGSVQNVLFLGFVDIGRSIGTIHRESHPAGVAIPTTSDEPLRSGPGLGPFLGGRYQCRDNSLHIDPPPGYPNDPNYSFDFTREGARRDP